MSDTPRDLWSSVLLACSQKLQKLREGPDGLRGAIRTPISFDTGRPPGNPRVEGLLTLLSWAGVGLGGLATLVTVFFTTGLPFQILLGITLVSLLYVVYEVTKSRRHAGPWYADAQMAVGCLLIANDDLYEAGTRMLPGGMLVTFDEELAADPERLIGLGRQLMEYYEADKAPTVELQAAIEWIDSDVYTPSFTRMRLPSAFTGNDDTWLVCLGIDQTAMPEGYLDRRLWPLFGRADKNEPVVLLPHKLWHRGDPRVDELMRGQSA